MIDDMDNPLSIRVLEFLQFLQGLFAFIVPALLMGWLIERRPFHYVKMDKSAMPLSIYG